MASRNVNIEDQFVQVNSLCTVPFRSWSQGQFCLEFVWCDCSMRLVQIVVFAHSFCSCTNNCFLLFGGIVQCEAASCRVQTKCGVCKTFLLYLDKAVGLLWFNFTMAGLRIWIGACFFVRRGVFPFPSTYFFVGEAWWIKACGRKLSHHWNRCVCLLKLIHVIRTRVCPRALAQGDSYDKDDVLFWWHRAM